MFVIVLKKSNRSVSDVDREIPLGLHWRPMKDSICLVVNFGIACKTSYLVDGHQTRIATTDCNVCWCLTTIFIIIDLKTSKCTFKTKRLLKRASEDTQSTLLYPTNKKRMQKVFPYFRRWIKFFSYFIYSSVAQSSTSLCPKFI